MHIELTDLIAALAKGGTTQSTGHSLPIGTGVFVRTVTYHYTGRLVAVTDTDIVLEDAAWIADSGRYHNALRDGLSDNAEIEPIPGRCIVSRGAMVDCVEYTHELPRTQR